MIKIITGIPGAGKTLWAVTQLKKIVDENNKLQATGYFSKDKFTTLFIYSMQRAFILISEGICVLKLWNK